MSPSDWGPQVWCFFHTLAQKVKEEEYPRMRKQLFTLIYRICMYLPCPECSQHATQFLNKINPDSLKTKQDLINLLYIFHNVVNKRKSKQLYNSDGLNTYENKNIINVYNNFVNVYNTKGNMNLIAESFQRNLILSDLKKWMMHNYNYFS